MIHSQSIHKISGYQKESETYFKGRLHGIAGGVGKEDIAYNVLIRAEVFRFLKFCKDYPIFQK